LGVLLSFFFWKNVLQEEDLLLQGGWPPYKGLVYLKSGVFPLALGKGVCFFFQGGEGGSGPLSPSLSLSLSLSVPHFWKKKKKINFIALRKYGLFLPL